MKFLQMFLAVLIFVSCKNNETSTADSKQKPINAADTLSTARVKEVLKLLKNKEFEKLSKQIHPENGLRFSPYGFIDVTNDMKFSNKEFLKQTKTSKKIDWGKFDGTGESISLNFKDYYEKFIYNADFYYAENISFNKTLSKGNSTNNIAEVYKDCVYAENYFKGFDPKLDGLDWTSLKLVFKKWHNKFYLVAIIHDQWTS